MNAMLRCFGVVGFVFVSSMVHAENHVFRPGEGGVAYGHPACNSDSTELSEAKVQCTAIFSDTSVWDFLNGLTQRITLEEMNEFNPALGTVTYDTIIGGLTFVRVQ